MKVNPNGIRGVDDESASIERWDNHELHERLARPRDTKEEAEKDMMGFLDGLKELREKHRIPEVMVMVAVNHREGQKVASRCRSLALGAPELRPKLGAMAYRMYTMPLIKEASELLEMARGAGLDEEG